MTETDRARWFDILKWDNEDFPASYFDRFENAGFTFYELNKRRWLVEIVTGAGAYQRSYVFAILDESVPKKPVVRSLTFSDYYFDENDRIQKQQTKYLSGRSSFDGRNKTLTIFYKGRGIGDCGSLINYKVIGSRTRTLEARLRNCDSSSSYAPPEKWPTVRLF